MMSGAESGPIPAGIAAVNASPAATAIDRERKPGGKHSKSWRSANFIGMGRVEDGALLVKFDPRDGLGLVFGRTGRSGPARNFPRGRARESAGLGAELRASVLR